MLLFVAGIVVICFLMIFHAGQKTYKAKKRISYANYRLQVADSLIHEAHDQIFEVSCYRDYGIWMVNHYGPQTCYYRRFMKSRSKYYKVKGLHELCLCGPKQFICICSLLAEHFIKLDLLSQLKLLKLHRKINNWT